MTATKLWAARRAALNLTQRQLAELAGCSLPLIQNLEYGRRVPRWLPLAIEALEARARHGTLPPVTPAPGSGWPKGKARKPRKPPAETETP